MGTPIHTITGWQNAKQSAKAVIAVIGDDEKFLNSSPKVVKIGKGTTYPAVSGSPMKTAGLIEDKQYEVEDGTILRFHVTKTLTHGMIPIAATMFLRVRAHAALIDIQARMVDGLQCAKLFGRLDILKDWEISQIQSNRMHGILSGQDYVNKVFTVTTVEREISTTGHARRIVISTGNQATLETKRQRILR